MHTARQLDVDMFRVTRAGRVADREDLLPAWDANDRLGVVLTEPFGAVGAAHLIQLAITAFYDVRPARRVGRPDGHHPDAVYPEIYLFHVDGAYGDHSAFDFWPARKEVCVKRDPLAVLDAVNDRAITRLAVPDRDPEPVEHEWKEPAAARDRIRSAFAYSPLGRVRQATWEVYGLDRRTEMNVNAILDPDRRYVGGRAAAPVGEDAGVDPRRVWKLRTEQRRDEGRGGLGIARQRREAIRDDDGLACETYRMVAVDDALGMLI